MMGSHVACHILLSLHLFPVCFYTINYLLTAKMLQKCSKKETFKIIPYVKEIIFSVC